MRKSFYLKVINWSLFCILYMCRILLGQKLSRFSCFWPFSTKVYAFEYFKTAKRESFFTQSYRYFQNRESFFERCKTYFSANLKALYKIYCYWQNLRHMDVLIYINLFFIYYSIILLQWLGSLSSFLPRKTFLLYPFVAYSQKRFHAKMNFFFIYESFFREICSKIHQTRKFLSKISRFFWHAKVSALKVSQFFYPNYWH